MTLDKGSVQNGIGLSKNNTTNYSTSESDQILRNVDNETVGSTPFAKSGADTFANRFVYFAPNDVGNVKGGAFG